MIGFNLESKVEWEKGLNKLPHFKHINSEKLSNFELWLAFPRLDIDLKRNELQVNDKSDYKRTIQLAIFYAGCFFCSQYFLADDIKKFFEISVCIAFFISVGFLISSEHLVNKKLKELKGYKFPENFRKS